MKYTYEWTLTDGRKVTLEAEYSEHVQDKIVDADGDMVRLNKREIVKEGMLVAYIDGKKIDSCWDTNFWQTVESGHKGIRKIWGIAKIGFTEERAKEIEAFLAEVIAAGKDAEAEEIRQKAEEKSKADRIASAMEVIQKAEAQQDIPEAAEAARRMRNYNNIHNEGGDGYVPYIYSREEYDAAKRILAELVN